MVASARPHLQRPARAGLRAAAAGCGVRTWLDAGCPAIAARTRTRVAAGSRVADKVDALIPNLVLTLSGILKVSRSAAGGPP